MPDVLQAAQEILTRREHSAHELRVKLLRKGYEEQEVAEVLAECQRLGYQSDARYVDSYCRMRVQQGDGPLKIEQFLRAKGIADFYIRVRLAEEPWREHAHRVWNKKFGSEEENTGLAAKGKQYRFLLSRGFSSSVINEIL